MLAEHRSRNIKSANQIHVLLMPYVPLLSKLHVFVIICHFFDSVPTLFFRRIMYECEGLKYLFGLHIFIYAMRINTFF